MTQDKGSRSRWDRARRRYRDWVGRQLVRVRRAVRPGLRLPLGIALIIGGLLGFLPILGFWMIPLGIAVAALDLRRSGAQRRR